MHAQGQGLREAGNRAGGPARRRRSSTAASSARERAEGRESDPNSEHELRIEREVSRVKGKRAAGVECSAPGSSFEVRSKCWLTDPSGQTVANLFRSKLRSLFCSAASVRWSAAAHGHLPSLSLFSLHCPKRQVRSLPDRQPACLPAWSPRPHLSLRVPPLEVDRVGRLGQDHHRLRHRAESKATVSI